MCSSATLSSGCADKSSGFIQTNTSGWFQCGVVPARVTASALWTDWRAGQAAGVSPGDVGLGRALGAVDGSEDWSI
jgi:hypothetical protein